MNVLFRCDGSRSIGLGHVFRSTNLALSVTAQGGRAFFALLEPGLPAVMAKAFPYPIRVVGPERDVGDTLSSADAARTAAVAAGEGASWIVVDTYAATDTYLKRLEEAGPWQICVIDDTGERQNNVDLLVNPSPGAERWARGGRVTLAGSRYALMHPAFAQAREASLLRVRPSPPRVVLVVLGGSDARGLSSQVVEVLLEALPDADVRVVLGPAAGGGPVGTSKRVEVLGPQTPAQMAEWMSAADLAVATPSTVAWELACLGVPSVFLRVADNQRRNADAIVEDDLAEVCDDVRSIPAALGRVLAMSKDARDARALRWAALGDGRGADRVATELVRKARSMTPPAAVAVGEGPIR